MAIGQVAGVKAALDKFISKTTADLAIEIVRALVIDTPRDTNWAASNWIASIGFAREGAVGSKDAVSFAAQKLSLASIATGYDISKGEIHITNNVPYIVKLNMGTSRQAPKMFVERAISEAIQRVLNRAA